MNKQTKATKDFQKFLDNRQDLEKKVHHLLSNTPKARAIDIIMGWMRQEEIKVMVNFLETQGT